MPEGLIVIFGVFWAIAAYFRFIYNGEKVEYSSSPANHFSLSLICDRLEGTINSDGSYCSGTIDGFSYSLKAEMKGGYILFINHKLPLDGLVNITKENLLSKLKKDFGQEDVLTGDVSFDEQILLSGNNPVELAGLLNEKNRIVILELSLEFTSFEISNSWIKAGIDFNVPSERIPDLVKRSVMLSSDLVKASDTITMLVLNIINDLDSGVRRNNLEMLASRYRQSKELIQICEKVLKDPSIGVQIEAASYLKDRGMEHLYGIVENQELSDIEAMKIVRAFGENSYRKGIPFLKEVYGQKKDKKTRKEILKVCKTFADEGLSSFLVDELCNGNSSLCSDILDALGACGDRKALETIHELYKQYMPGSARNEAYGTMGQIQSRLGVDKGWLSVAELGETEGALSVAKENAEGALSMTDKKEKKR